MVRIRFRVFVNDISFDLPCCIFVNISTYIQKYENNSHLDIAGTASVARGYSGYVDKLTNKSMSMALGDSMPISVSFLSDYPDFLAFGLSFILSSKFLFAFIMLYKILQLESMFNKSKS